MTPRVSTTTAPNATRREPHKPSAPSEGAWWRWSRVLSRRAIRSRGSSRSTIVQRPRCRSKRSRNRCPRGTSRTDLLRVHRCRRRSSIHPEPPSSRFPQFHPRARLSSGPGDRANVRRVPTQREPEVADTRPRAGNTHRYPAGALAFLRFAVGDLPAELFHARIMAHNFSRHTLLLTLWLPEIRRKGFPGLTERGREVLASCRQAAQSWPHHPLPEACFMTREGLGTPHGFESGGGDR